MCGKDGWIYNVDDKGNITNKSLNTPPKDIDKFMSHNVAKEIKKEYIEIINT
jgi:hypothetical protein